MDEVNIEAIAQANPFAMQALADSLQGVDVPVLVKNPVNPDPLIPRIQLPPTPR